MPVREGRRNRPSRTSSSHSSASSTTTTSTALRPVWGIILGTDSMLALTDGVGLSTDDAKTVTLDAARRLLAGAVA